MVGMTDYFSRGVLDYMTGKTALPAVSPAYVALFIAVGADDGTGFTEPSGGSYARVATSAGTWAAASGSSPSITSNAAAVAFPTATSNQGTVFASGLFDAATGGNLRTWDYLGGFSWLPFTCAASGVITSYAHGFANGDSIVVTGEFGGALPNVATNWNGLLTVSNVTADTFTVGVTVTSSGDGFLKKVASLAIVSGNIPTFAVGQLAYRAF